MPSNDVATVGKWKWTLKERSGEHEQVVKQGNPKNGSSSSGRDPPIPTCYIDWDSAKVNTSVSGHWKPATSNCVIG